MKRLALAFVALLATARAGVTDEVENYLLRYRLYADGAYAWSSTRPGNGIWRSKQTTYRLDDPELNLAMAEVWKAPEDDSRWGFRLGAQTGRDTELAVPEGGAIGSAKFWSHVYRASVSCLLPDGIEIEAGLLPGPIGYESYLSFENPTYTRGFITDYVPYFVFGVNAKQPISDSLDLSFSIVTGWDYLAHPNDVPGFGLKADWRVNERVRCIQNLYFGPEQETTAFGFWRFFSESIVEHRHGPLRLAFSFDFGTEQQAGAPGDPRAWVFAAAAWLRWDLDDHWTVGLRPEIYDDADGMMTGSRQTLYDVSLALRYRIRPGLLLSLEYSYGRSTGAQGGFFSGPDDDLVGEQHVLLLALTWSFEDGFARRATG